MTDSRRDVPLVVDLDGSLLATDSLWESLLALIRRDPSGAIRCAGVLARGRAAFKAAVSSVSDLDPATLPFREEVLTFVRREREEGREVMLATAADRRVAERIASHLGLFTQVLASDNGVNLRGVRKLEAIRAATGGRPFDYLGDARADRVIWASADLPLVVAPSLARARALVPDRPVRAFVPPAAGWPLLRALRPHQWVKNGLLAVPALAAHVVTEPDILVPLVLAVVAFSCAASGGYLVNDLLDLAADRHHPEKRQRPVARGQVSLARAALVAVGLLGGSGILALAALPAGFAAAVGVYVALTLGYSLHLKRVPIVDVLVLSGLYGLRIIAGGAAVHVPVSPWLLAFAMFLFLSLAFVKRYGELHLNRAANVAAIEGRGYRSDDLEIVRSVGPASGYIAVLVLALYVTSDKVLVLYQHPDLLWLLMPLLVYWITRVWFVAGRGALDHDPVVFALRDPVSRVIAVVALVILLLAA